MKKKIVCVLVLLFGLSNFLNANSFIIGVEYLGTTTQISIYDAYNNYVTYMNKEYKKNNLPYYEVSVSKTTKEEDRLLWQGLNRYDYKAGEIYCIHIFSDRFLSFFVEIKKDGSCSWYASTAQWQ